MQAYRDFTLDSTNFPQSEVKSFVDGLHANGQHFVPIVDPGIMIYSGYDAYESGVKKDLFVKDIKGNYYMTQVWPGPTYMPDFFNPETSAWWQGQLQSFHDMVPYDGAFVPATLHPLSSVSFIVLHDIFSNHFCHDNLL
jgi:alpha-D-xyloside xylohydrolase